MLEVAGGIIIAFIVIGLFVFGAFVFLISNEEDFLGSEKAKVFAIVVIILSLVLMAWIALPQFN